MREIKYRAYIKKLGWMIPVEIIDFNCEIVELDLSAGQGDTSDYEFEEVELMQYTNLKDKNDKEIYEGDIIKLTYADKKTVVECVVKYVDDCAYYMLEDIKDSDNLDTFCGFSNEQFEVIGNIYENKELIE